MCNFDRQSCLERNIHCYPYNINNGSVLSNYNKPLIYQTSIYRVFDLLGLESFSLNTGFMCQLNINVIHNSIYRTFKHLPKRPDKLRFYYQNSDFCPSVSS